ncbi:MAG: hypothetical protein HY962_08860 [Ignavibacteriae bacterium]|nr:hypothetical protein [Ignavibacteriota bacterium]
MNEARVRRLAKEGRVELTRKMFKRLTRDGYAVTDLVTSLTISEIKNEDVLAYPDFACALGTRDTTRRHDIVCVQTGDGTTVRLVGLFHRKPPAPPKQEADEE